MENIDIKSNLYVYEIKPKGYTLFVSDDGEDVSLEVYDQNNNCRMNEERLDNDKYYPNLKRASKIEKEKLIKELILNKQNYE